MKFFPIILNTLRLFSSILMEEDFVDVCIMRSHSIRRRRTKQRNSNTTCLTAMDKLTSQQIEEYEEAFQMFDHDGNNYITTKELKALLRCLGCNPTDCELQKIVNEVDVDGNSKVDFPEFVALMERMKSPKEEKESILEAFRVFDVEGRGFVASKQIREMLKCLDQVPVEEIDDLIEFSGLHEDRNIDLSEFTALLIPRQPSFDTTIGKFTSIAKSKNVKLKKNSKTMLTFSPCDGRDVKTSI